MDWNSTLGTGVSIVTIIGTTVGIIIALRQLISKKDSPSPPVYVLPLQVDEGYVLPPFSRVGFWPGWPQKSNEAGRKGE